MFDACCSFFKCMLYENGEPSLTRFLSVVAFTAFLICSAYLMIKDQTWAHYDTFAYITGGGGTTAQLFNKFVNCKYNSSQGGRPVKSAEPNLLQSKLNDPSK